MTSVPATPIVSSPTYRVYYKYALDDAIPHPGSEWTRFVCISDTHRKQTPMVDGDVLIHAGDFSSFTTGFRPCLDWIKGLSHSQKILIAGNHEFNLDERCVNSYYSRNDLEVRAELEEDRNMLRDQSAIDAKLTYLEAESASIPGEPSSDKRWRVYGSPYTPEFGTMGFSYRPDEAEDIWAPTPQDTEILVTHGPPLRILDVTRHGMHVGCPALRETILDHLPSARLHVFGHIHEARGVEVHKGPEGRDIVFVNPACGNHKNLLPIIVDLKNSI
ncbi:Metallo-dependent phosphatase [Ceratobasidium sp. AG-I]|nr:Metallo-dependent phosphatase [Ceratobasidium sp. AG-I]